MEQRVRVFGRARRSLGIGVAARQPKTKVAGALKKDFKVCRH